MRRSDVELESCPKDTAWKETGLLGGQTVSRGPRDEVTRPLRTPEKPPRCKGRKWYCR